MRRLTPYLGFVALSFLAAASGALFPPGEWYAGLRKPWFTPPDAAFPVVWSVLYLCMGISAALVFESTRNRRVLIPWGLQLALNALWSPLFFGLHQPLWAFAVIVLLWCAIVATLAAFGRVRPSAAWLLAPYLAWVTLAAALNSALWYLNRA